MDCRRLFLFLYLFFCWINVTFHIYNIYLFFLFKNVSNSLEPIPKFDRIIAHFPLLINYALHPEEGGDKEEGK